MTAWQASARTLGASAILLVGVAFAGCERGTVDPSPVEFPTAQPGPAPEALPVERSTGPLAFVSTRDGSPHVYLANADGSAVTRLTQGEAPAWSPDGTKLVFDRRATGLLLLSVINADGSGERVLGSGRSADWSPDGASIVFSDQHDVFVMNVDGSERRKLVGVDRSDEVWPRDADWPSWSPLNIIAFVRAGYEVVWEIHLVNTDGSAPRRLVDSPGSSRPAWSPDGSTLAFSAWDGIRTVRVDGSGLSMRVRGEDLFSPDWTPDGGFVLSRFTAPWRTRIFVAKSGGIRQFVPDVEAPAQPEYDDHSPVWARR